MRVRMVRTIAQRQALSDRDLDPGGPTQALMSTLKVDLRLAVDSGTGSRRVRRARGRL